MAEPTEQYRGLSFKQMLNKLRELYDREDAIIKEANKLKAEYIKLQEDKDLLQTMYMYASNRVNEK